MKIAANLNAMFGEHAGLAERYAAAAKAGFRLVETANPYELEAEEVAKLLEKHGLTQVQINSPVGGPGERGMACVPGREQEFRDSIARAIRYAKAMQCQRVHVVAGLNPADALRLQCEDVFEANLSWAAKTLGAEGITALIEPISPAAVQGYFLASFDQALGYIQKIREPSLRLQLDTFHAQQLSGDALGTLKKHLSHTGHIQIAQSPKRGDPGTDGDIDFAAVFKFLQAEGWDGIVACEYFSSADTPATLAWIQTHGLAL